MGLDFVAVADRPVKGFVVAYHYSLQYWESPCEMKTGQPLKPADIKDGKKLASVELLADEGWRVWTGLNDPNSNQKIWKIINIAISVIHYADKGINTTVLYQDEKQKVQNKWDSIIMNAKNYAYAEQNPSNGNLKNWPNSKYQYPWDSPFNNSNTFVRYLVAKAGLTMIELGGKHPGADSPMPVSNIYGGNPWKGGASPPQPSTNP